MGIFFRFQQWFLRLSCLGFSKVLCSQPRMAATEKREAAINWIHVDRKLGNNQSQIPSLRIFYAIKFQAHPEDKK